MRSSVGHRAAAVQLPHHLNSSGTSIGVPDLRQFDKCAAKPLDGKASRRLPGELLRTIDMLALGDPSLGRTLVAACHCAQRTKETPRFLWRRLAVGRSYAIKGGQEGFFFRALNCVTPDMVPTGSRNAHTCCLSLPAPTV